MNSRQLSVIDLFAGCGGLSRGFMDAGFNVILGVDNDEAALKTFKRNHGNATTFNADLSKTKTYFDMDKLLFDHKVDVIIAGPPCQGFSLTGPREFDDPRNSLYLAVFEAVNRYKPKAFVVENVPGMASLYKGEIKKEVVRRFENLGYAVKSDVLCAADYGVPQVRKRLFFLGVRRDIGLPVFPAPVIQPHQYITCRQAIDDLPPRTPSDDSAWFGLEIDSYIISPTTEYQKKMRGDCNTLYNHVATKHKQFVIDTIAQVPEGCNYKSLPKGVGESRKFNEAWTRYHGDKPSKTIDTGHRNHFHYEYNRVPTIRENARLQSFPDDFVFLGTRTQQNRQVGNAVPPLLGHCLGLKVRELFT
ncbi:MAG: DNA cytosine methyltransferase [Oscillospiraceae bacterium]|jgi:DNA (cytosine-5)-methyltransferase 1|nr:DNA cytosine methyltransferase [Oscillospiraceae bacterium]